MSKHMRFFSWVVLLSCAGMAGDPRAGYAAMTASQWQDQLQAEMQALSAMTPSLKIDGSVVVKQEQGKIIATLPMMTVNASVASRFVIPSIHFYADKTAFDKGGAIPVQVVLPEMISYHNQAGAERGYVKITTQNLTGTLRMSGRASGQASGHYFETLSGSLQNVIYHDKIGQRQTGIEQIVLDASNASRPVLTATKIQNVAQSSGAVLRSSVDSAVLTYQFAEQTHMTLPRVVGLLNPVMFLTERQPFTIDVAAQNIVHTDRKVQTATIQQMNTRLQVVPGEQDAFLGGRLRTDIYNVTQQPESAVGFILPKKLTILGALHNMPVQILNQPFDVAHELMIQSGARADISEILWNTDSKTSIYGTGWVRAAANVPLGMVGRLELTIEDLRSLSAVLQKQLATPGTNLKAKTQGYMVLMLLQSLAKGDDTSSKIMLDLTPDGQVLVNNQDISALLGGSQR